jgi:hypothetical protein
LTSFKLAATSLVFARMSFGIVPQKEKRRLAAAKSSIVGGAEQDRTVGLPRLAGGTSGRN